MDANFLPTIPPQLSHALLFGVLLVAGMLGGEGARRLQLPRVIGYVFVGFAIAPIAAAMGMSPLLDHTRIFVDIALGLVLFDLGRRMDLAWMKRDWTLAASGVAESFISFGLVFATLMFFDFPPLQCAIAASIAMATSPAVVLLGVQDLRSEGQVTERALNLTALNSLIASILVTILLASAHYDAGLELETVVLHPLYLFLGSLLLGGILAAFARLVARQVERSPELHFTLIVGLVVGAVGAAQSLKLSVILALLAFGLFSRNDEGRHDLLTVDLGRGSRLFYIVLFVITGASLPVTAFEAAGWGAFAFVAARAIGKMAGVLAFSPLGGLRMRQAVALGATLMPMSGLALLLQHDVSRVYPQFGQALAATIIAGVIIVEFVGPLLVQWGLKFAGEAAPDPVAAPATPHPPQAPTGPSASPAP
jgi:Kef-type K+ transport system membrane component KefB